LIRFKVCQDIPAKHKTGNIAIKMARNDRWRIVNPEGIVGLQKSTVNCHPRSLSRKTVVLYWNGKPNGDVFLNRIGELLRERVNDVKVIKAWEADPSTRQTDSNPSASQAVANRLAELKPDMVIGAPGDCSGSATWLVIDLLNTERLGVPTVTIVSSPYAVLVKTIPTNEGFSDACIVDVPPPIGMIPDDEVREKAELAFAEILRAATEWQPLPVTGAQRAVYPSDTFDFYGTVEDINRYFLEKKWASGLPILPPTPELVRELLRGTCRNPEEVLGHVPPRMGTITVELAAVHAAMCGCRPEHMPLLIAALEGLLSPEANLRLALSGTGTSQIIVLVNGPIIKEIGIGYSQGAAGKGYHANAGIGYAVNSIAFAIGGSTPPLMDRSTLGSPADYVCWVFGENEDALPGGWPPFHLERGFAKSDSVVTVMASYPPVNCVDHWSSSIDEHMRWWGGTVSPLLNMGGPCLPEIMEQNPIIALGPEHAGFIASAGWTKNDFRAAFWNAARIPFSVWPAGCGGDKFIDKFGHVTPESLIPVTLKPEQLIVIVAGGDGKQSHYFAPYPGSFPVSRLVKG
jgi:hypothetical protein